MESPEKPADSDTEDTETLYDSASSDLEESNVRAKKVADDTSQAGTASRKSSNPSFHEIAPPRQSEADEEIKNRYGAAEPPPPSGSEAQNAAITSGATEAVGLPPETENSSAGSQNNSTKRADDAEKKKSRWGWSWGSSKKNKKDKKGTKKGAEKGDAVVEENAAAEGTASEQNGLGEKVPEEDLSEADETGDSRQAEPKTEPATEDDVAEAGSAKKDKKKKKKDSKKEKKSKEKRKRSKSREKEEAEKVVPVVVVEDEEEKGEKEEGEGELPVRELTPVSDNTGTSPSGSQQQLESSAAPSGADDSDLLTQGANGDSTDNDDTMNSRKYKLKSNDGGSQPNSVFGGSKDALDSGTFKAGTAPRPGSALEDSGESDNEGTLGRGDDRGGSLTRRSMGKMTVKQLQELKRNEEKRLSDKKKAEKLKKKQKKSSGKGDISGSDTLGKESGSDNNAVDLSGDQEKLIENDKVDSAVDTNTDVKDEPNEEQGESNAAFVEGTDTIKPPTSDDLSTSTEVLSPNIEHTGKENVEQKQSDGCTTGADDPDKQNITDDEDDAVFEEPDETEQVPAPEATSELLKPERDEKRTNSVTFAEPEIQSEEDNNRPSVTFEDETKNEKKKEKRKSFLKRKDSKKEKEKEKEREEKKKEKKKDEKKERKGSKKEKKKSSKKRKGDEKLLDSETEKTEESEPEFCKEKEDELKDAVIEIDTLEKNKIIEKPQVPIETDEEGENEKVDTRKNKKMKKKDKKSKKSKKKKDDADEPADQLIIIGLEDNTIIPRKPRPEENKMDLVKIREDEEKEDMKLFTKFQRREKSRKRNEKIKECCKKFAAFLFSHIGLCGLVVGYSIMGGFVFKALEAPFEYKQKLNIRNQRENTVDELWKIAVRLSANDMLEVLQAQKPNFTMAVNVELKKFQELLFDATKNKGWDGKDAKEGEEPELQWSYAGALLYAVTVVTTIGYGHVAPKTSWGRLITILYALVGIPLTFLYLSNIGNFLADCFRVVYGKICCGLCCCYCKKHRNRRRRRLSRKATNDSQNGDVGAASAATPATTVQYDVEENYIEEEEEDKEKITVPVSLCLVIITGYIIGGATLFSIWEQWDYLTGSYFCFITLSTIGFGDIVPGTNFSTWAAQEKLLLAALYVVFGLSLLAMCFNLMQEEVKEKCKRLGKKIGIVIERDSPKRDPERETQL